MISPPPTISLIFFNSNTLQKKFQIIQQIHLPGEKSSLPWPNAIPLASSLSNSTILFHNYLKQPGDSLL